MARPQVAPSAWCASRALLADRRAFAPPLSASAEFARQCRDAASEPPGLETALIADLIDPTSEQRAIVEELNPASTRAGEQLRCACPDDLAPTPVARLEALERQVDLMLQAVQTVRPSMEKLDRSLSGEQHARLAAATLQGPARQDRSRRRGDVGSLCEREASGAVDWPAGAIEQAVQPNEQRRNALFDVWAAAAKAANTLRAACPREIPMTPFGRVQATEKRLEATQQAVKTFRTALADAGVRSSPCRR